MDYQNLIHTLNQRVRFINKHLNEQLKQYGLYHAQWTILFLLKNNGTMTLTEITKYLNVEAPTVTRTLKRMEDNGWVKKVRGSDKRERVIQLTDAAEMKYKDIEHSVTLHEQEMLANLTDEERETFYLLLTKLG